MTKDDYLRLRAPYAPEHAEVVFAFESPPVSGKYFYDPEGAVSETLFDTMMKDVLKIPQRLRTKAEGAHKVQTRKISADRRDLYAR